MALTILSSYRPNAASTARTSASLSSVGVVTAGLYARFTATSVGGSIFGAAGARICSIANDPYTGCEWSIYRSFSGAGILASDFGGDGASAGTTGDVSVSPSVGDLIEVRVLLNIAGKTVIAEVSKNGAAVVTGPTFTYTGVAGAYGAGGNTPKLWINSFGGSSSFADQSILAVCYASGAPTMADFRDWFNTIPEVLGDRPHSPQHQALMAC